VTGGRFLVTGARGTVGRRLVEALQAAGQPVASAIRGPDGLAERLEFAWNLREEEAPAALLRWRPDRIIHAAAMTDVDACERASAEAEAVNVGGTQRVARLAATVGARLVFLSTDSVFDGERGGYGDDELPNPVNVYAATKLGGERAAAAVPNSLVVRFNVISGERLTRWALTSVAEGVPIRVFTDVRFNPIEARVLAEMLVRLSLSPLEGVCHIASDEVISKAEFVQRLIAYADLLPRAPVTPARWAAAPGGAPRPLDTSLRVSPRVAALLPVPSLDASLRRLAQEFTAGRPTHSRH
jgi:dTDP-4-dehydrorhamnose reductase